MSHLDLHQATQLHFQCQVDRQDTFCTTIIQVKPSLYDFNIRVQRMLIEQQTS